MKTFGWSDQFITTRPGAAEAYMKSSMTTTPINPGISFYNCILRTGSRHNPIERIKKEVATNPSLPILILHGEGNGNIAVQLAYDAKEAIPPAELIISPECGHFFWMEQPELSLKYTQQLIKNAEKIAAVQ